MSPLELASVFPTETPIVLGIGAVLGYLSARLEDRIRHRRDVEGS